MSNMQCTIFLVSDDSLSLEESKKLDKCMNSEYSMCRTRVAYKSKFTPIYTISISKDDYSEKVRNIILPIISSHNVIFQSITDEDCVIVDQYINGECVYSMEGYYYFGKYTREDDTNRDAYPEFDKQCETASSDPVIYITEDDQIFIRKFEPRNIIRSINGSISCDKRAVKDPYYILI